MKHGTMQELGFSRALDRQLHVVVDGTQRCACVLVLHQQPGYLAQRRQAAAGDHGCGDDAAHGHGGFLRLVNADDHHGDRHHLLHGLHKAHRGRRNQLELAAGLRDELGGAFPVALDGALRVQRFHGLQAGQRFHQRRVALRTGLEAGHGQRLHAGLRGKRHQQNQDDGNQRRQDHPRGNPGQRGQEQQDEGQVDQRGDRSGCDEVADGFE
ncbi:hypothetical protein D3C72_1158670 [compost metagenome]